MAFPSYTRNEGEVELDEVEDSCHEGNADLVHLKNNYDAARAAGKNDRQ